MAQTQNNTFQWGIIGPGAIAEKFARDLRFVPGAIAHSVCSRDQERAAAFANTHGFAKHYSAIDTFLADPELDIVYIATPHPFHLDQALAAIDAQKSVLIEKPVTMTADQARHIHQAAQAKGVFVMEALWTRFLPAVQRAKALVDSGQLGAIGRAEATLHFHRPFEAGHRLFDPALGGGVLLDLGVYPLSVMRFLLGALKLETAQWQAAPTGVDMQAKLSLSAGKVPVSISCGFEKSHAHEGENTLVLYGEKKTLRLDRHFLRAQSLTVWDEPMQAAPQSRSLVNRLRNKIRMGSGTTERFGRTTTGLNFQAAAVQYACANSIVSHPTMPMDQSVEVLAIIEAALSPDNKV